MEKHVTEESVKYLTDEELVNKFGGNENLIYKNELSRRLKLGRESLERENDCFSYQ